MRVLYAAPDARAMGQVVVGGQTGFIVAHR
jgi:hypothetical protein